MKKLLIATILLAMALSLMACTKAEGATEAPTTETTAAPSEPTQSKPILPITADTPLATGSGCATSPAEVAE